MMREGFYLLCCSLYVTELHFSSKHKCMFDHICVVDWIKKMLGHFHNVHLASHSVFDPGSAHVALIKPMRSHTCVAAWLEVAHCQTPQPLDCSGISYRAVLLTCTTAGVKRLFILYITACNDVLRLG